MKKIYNFITYFFWPFFTLFSVLALGMGINPFVLKFRIEDWSVKKAEILVYNIPPEQEFSKFFLTS